MIKNFSESNEAEVRNQENSIQDILNNQVDANILFESEGGFNYDKLISYMHGNDLAMSLDHNEIVRIRMDGKITYEDLLVMLPANVVDGVATQLGVNNSLFAFDTIISYINKYNNEADYFNYDLSELNPFYIDNTFSDVVSVNYYSVNGNIEVDAFDVFFDINDDPNVWSEFAIAEVSTNADFFGEDYDYSVRFTDGRNFGFNDELPEEFYDAINKQMLHPRYMRDVNEVSSIEDLQNENLLNSFYQNIVLDVEQGSPIKAFGFSDYEINAGADNLEAAMLAGF